MKKLRIFKCEKCGEVVVKLIDKCDSISCCGNKMIELKANVVDASKEKHMPVVEMDNNLIKVSVGSTIHPMTEEHFINFIILETNYGFKVANLSCKDVPIVTFAITENEKCLNVYEYCSLHGLWVIKLK